MATANRLDENSSPSDEINAPRISSKWSKWRVWLMPLTLFAAAFALQAFAARAPQLVERYYSHRLFPPIVHVLSLINGVVGFSIAELMIYVLAAAVVGLLVYQVRQICLRRRRIAALLRTDLMIGYYLMRASSDHN